ncbi:MAG: ATP-binding protein, partial [Propionibacteriaceae bacterium]|nr:ATP-binding protein [Propionibacteriaceae bacterium]
MSLARARSIALTGLEATVVEVEVWIGSGLPRTVVVGLPDAALSDAKERCRAAVASVGLAWPAHVVINLTPATLPKAGSHYDLAMTAAVLAADDVVPAARLDGAVMLGELGLDGKVRPVRGVLPALLAAGRQGVAHAVVPADQRAEAALVEGIEVHGVASLSDLIALLRGRPVTLPDVPQEAAAAEAPPSQMDDLADVYGLAEARWTLEVAAAGRHHLYFHGPP